jgi:hypothetical protein
MGYVIPDLGYGDVCWNNSLVIELTASVGSPAEHTGISLGLVDSDDTVEAALSLAAGALVSTAALGNAIGALPTLNVGPWSGVVPATWWAGLSSDQKAGFRTLIQHKVRSGRLW